MDTIEILFNEEKFHNNINRLFVKINFVKCLIQRTSSIKEGTENIKSFYLLKSKKKYV